MSDQTDLDDTFTKPGPKEDPLPDLDLSSVSSLRETDFKDPQETRSSELRFEVKSQLGQGGMGTVFRVRDRDLQRDVAFKTLHNQTASNLRGRFIRESRITGQLSHPNIVPLYDIGNDENGNLYLSMQLIEGETLHSLIARLKTGDPETHEKYSITRRLEIFLKIISAVDFAHAQGVIHRDLKPANIMIGKFDEVFVMDWGLADYYAENIAQENYTMEETAEGTVMGTTKYMSPEQAAGQISSLGPATDIYSLCAILHEFLSLEHYLGLPPDANRIAYTSALMSKEPVWVDQIKHDFQPRISRWLGLTVSQGLRKDPAERFDCLAQLAHDIRSYTAGKREPICPHTKTQRILHDGVSLLDEYPFQVAIGFLIILGLTIFGAGAWVAYYISNL